MSYSRLSQSPRPDGLTPLVIIPHSASAASKSTGNAHLKGRARSSSIVMVEEVGGDGLEEDLDRAAYNNINSDWVNRKGMYQLYETSSYN